MNDEEELVDIEIDLNQLLGKNPFAKRLKKQVTINLDENVVSYFKQQSEHVGIPYQTLINLYLRDCVAKNRQIDITWN